MLDYPQKTVEEILVDSAGITQAQVTGAQKEASRSGESLLRALVRLHFATEKELLEALSQELNLRFLSLEAAPIDLEAVSALSAKVATHYGVMPVSIANGRLSIAINDPFNFEMLDELKVVLGRDFDLALAAEEDISWAIKKYYGLGAETVERLLSEAESGTGIIKDVERKEEDLDEVAAATEASVIKFVNLILIEAVKNRATDIHLEPFEDEFRVRYRIDGILHEADVPASIRHFRSAIVSRIKIMASLNIAEKRLPQDGRMNISLAGDQFDLRVSILPTAFGEGVSIRILTRGSVFYGLNELGLSEEELVKIDSLIKRPHGIILVTGPTGSGKTTTLYGCLNKLKSVESKILTIEDPIEYQIRGITQMQVKPEIGFTFGHALRSMLRHDPDIMLVGEVRDLETAEITIRTALTGHLVFSTLHTNDAAGAVTRLFDMGIEPYLASSSVIGIIAQRLVRLICPECRQNFRPDEEALREIGASPSEIENGAFHRGAGCEACRYTGYRGRTGIFEIMLVNDKIRELMLNQTPSNIIKQKAQEMGMHTLRQDGWEKVKRGITTIEEVLRVAQEDEFLEIER